jgi:hypothetical protein
MTASAVITADIVNSTALARTELKKLIKNLESLLEKYRFEFYRGDSFQVYVKSPAEALPLVLKARATAMRYSASSSPETDIRASIGIGRVKPPVKILHTNTDEAFVLSGRAFDSIGGERLLITCDEANKKIQPGLRIAAHFADYIFRRITTKQAAVVLELLMKRTQVETARKLKKSQATVNKHLQAAGWPDIEELLNEYRLLTEAIEI